MKKLKLLLTLILVLSLDLNAQLDCNGFIIQDQTITTTTTDQSNCPDLSQGFTVSLDGSQTGVSYVVRNPETQANVSSMEAGTGGPLQFNISTSEERVDYRVVGIGGSDPGALSFDGVDDRLDLGTGSRGLFRSLTASIWVKTTQSGATSLLTKYPSAGGNAAGFRLAMDTNGKVFFQGRALGQPSRSSGESTTSINDGSWHYITGTVQIDNSSAGGETWKIYVDGVEENSLTTGSLLANLGTAIPLIAGGDDSDSFVGEIDQIAMWNTVLSATTIANFNDGCVDLGNPNLAAFYTLDEVEDGIFKDFSQVDADASFVNGDTFDAQSEGQIVCTLSGCSFSQCYVTPSCEYLLTDQVRLGDFTPPNAIANALTTFVIPSSGTLNINASQLDNGSADDCTAVADLMFSVSPSTFTCVDAGIQNVQFTVTDEDGNSATVSTQVEIVGPIADQTVTLRGGSFCPDGNSVATVDLFGSQVGVDYSLIDSDDNTILAGPVVGTGGPISLTTGSLTVSRTAYVEGKAGATQGSAIAFDGVDDRLFLGNDFRNISNQVTVALWVKTTSTTGETLVQKLSSNSGFRIFMDTQGRVRIDGRNGAAALKNSPYSTTAINDGQWHLVVGRVTLGSLGSNDLWSISVDGVSEGSGGLTNTGVFTPSLASGNMLEVGGDVNRNFDGEIDQIAIFNRYLTDNEVSNIQSNGCDIADTLPGVVAFFNLDEGEGTSLNDASSLAIGGTASLDTATAWVTGNLACEQCLSTVGMAVVLGDNVSPVPQAQDLTLSLDVNGQVVLNASDLDMGSTDDCSDSLSFAISDSLLTKTYDCAHLGVNNEVLTVSDGANQATVPVSVTIIDEIAPSFNVLDLTTGVDQDGNVSIAPGDVVTDVVDNCDDDVIISLSKYDFSCMDLGSQQVTVTATDSSGNQSSSQVTVTVIDQIAPTILTKNLTLQLDADGLVSVPARDFDDGSTDNCSAAADLRFQLVNNTSARIHMVHDNLTSNFSCSDLGINHYQLQVEDASGNRSTANVIITIEDTIAPTVLAKDITIALDDSGSAIITPSDVDSLSSDNCSFTLSLDKTNFNISNLGENAVTLSATDASGNTSTGIAKVTVVETKDTQTISFTALPDTVYGTPPINLSASSSSGLPVSFRLVSGLATLSDGNVLSANGVSTVVVEAIQMGNADFEPADPVRQEFSVNKKLLTATADDQQIEVGADFPVFSISYDGFVFLEDESFLNEKPTVNVSISNTSESGEYEIALSGGSDDNYELVLISGQLTISEVLGINDINSMIYPNPVVNTIQVVHKNVDFFEVLVMNGRIVKTAEASTELDISDLQPGNYILKIHSREGDILFHRFIKY